MIATRPDSVGKSINPWSAAGHYVQFMDILLNCAACKREAEPLSEVFRATESAHPEDLLHMVRVLSSSH